MVKARRQRKISVYRINRSAPSPKFLSTDKSFELELAVPRATFRILLAKNGIDDASAA